MKRFKARVATVVEIADINVLAVLVAENEDGSGARLEIQRARSFDEQDRALGQDTYCLCTETGATHYGGVKAWTITAYVLEIRLDVEASSALDVREGFLITIEPEHAPMLQTGLPRVLDLIASAAN